VAACEVSATGDVDVTLQLPTPLVGTYTDLVDLMTLTAQGKVTLHTTTYPLDAINDAMADLDGGRLQGRGILVPAGG
jgi:NAD+-dependent secondary alcohol dehydrogenase Adh1